MTSMPRLWPGGCQGAIKSPSTDGRRPDLSLETNAINGAQTPGRPTPSAIDILTSMELIFEIRDAEEGGYYARALGHAIFTEAETWEELRKNALEAASLHFEDYAIRPRIMQLHYVRDGNHTPIFQ